MQQLFNTADQIFSKYPSLLIQTNNYLFKSWWRIDQLTQIIHQFHQQITSKPWNPLLWKKHSNAHIVYHLRHLAETGRTTLLMLCFNDTETKCQWKNKAVIYCNWQQHNNHRSNVECDNSFWKNKPKKKHNCLSVSNLWRHYVSKHWTSLFTAVLHHCFYQQIVSIWCNQWLQLDTVTLHFIEKKFSAADLWKDRFNLHNTFYKCVLF